MDLSLSQDEARFRAEVRAFLATELSEEMRSAERSNPGFLSEHALGRDWQRRLHRQGWSAPAWPEQHGGTGWSLMQRCIFDQECERAGEPHFRGPGHRMLAPVLMQFGTAAQQARYLPRILSGEDYWAQGYSEPNAGSDLAALNTRALREGDDYVVTGSKIWTTHAHVASHIFVLVRTAAAERKQDGISFLLIPLDLPGISVRPIRSICGTHEFNQVFFDAVRVPAENLIGNEGDGWTIAKYLLSFERGGSFAAGGLRAAFARLLDLAEAPGPDGRRPVEDSGTALQLAQLATRLDAYEVMELGMLSELERHGRNPGALASSVMKVQRTRLRQSLTELGALLIGVDALEAGADPTERAMAPLLYFNARGQSVFGGSNEIQLEIIAKELLG